MHHLAQLKMYMEPYKGFLKTRLDQAGDIQLAATALHREITGQGYGGRITIVQRFLKRICPSRNLSRSFGRDKRRAINCSRFCRISSRAIDAARVYP